MISYFALEQQSILKINPNRCLIKIAGELTGRPAAAWGGILRQLLENMVDLGYDFIIHYIIEKYFEWSALFPGACLLYGSGALCSRLDPVDLRPFSPVYGENRASVLRFGCAW